MAATTELYLQLQRLYREQAEADVSAVERHARELLQRIGRDPGSLPRSAVALFVKNARNIRCDLLRFSPKDCPQGALAHACADAGRCRMTLFCEFFPPWHEG